MIQRFILQLSFGMLLLASTTMMVLAQNSVRVWTDSTGKFKVTAVLVESRDGQVQLKTNDGKLLKIPINRLSTADQKFLNDDSNPFEVVGQSDAPMTDQAVVSSTGNLESWSDPLEIDWSKVREIKPRKATTWNVPKVNNSLGFEVAKGQLKLGLIPKEKSHNAIAINARCKRAVVGFSGTENDGKVKSRITIIDLVSGRAIQSQSLEGHFRPATLLDDGTTVAMIGAAKWPKKENLRNEMQLWKFEGTQIKQSATWRPFESTKKSPGRNDDGAVYDAIPVVDNRIITHSSNGRVVLWDFENRKPLWYAQGDSQHTGASVTVDGRHLAFFDGQNLSIIDLTTGTSLGSVAIPDNRMRGWERVCWSPSGERILVMMFGSVNVLDVAKGQWLYGYQLSEDALAKEMWDYPHDDYALIDDGVLVHVPSKIKVCTYRGSLSVRTYGGVSFVTAWNKSDGLLMPIELPHSEVNALLAKAESDPMPFVLYPDASMAIDSSKVPTQYRSEVDSLVKKAIEASGYKVDPSADVTVVTSITGPKPGTVRFFGAGTYSVSEYNTELVLKWNNENIYRRSAGNIPGMVQTKRGQSMQQALDEFSKKPALSFIGTMRFPRYVQKPVSSAGIRALIESKITTDGIQ